MQRTVSIVQAARDIFSSRRLPVVLVAGTLLGLLPYIGIDATGRTNTTGTVLSLAVTLVVFGYQLSYAHQVSTHMDPALPSLFSLSHLQRGLVGTVASSIPVLLFFALSSALSWLVGVLAPEGPEWLFWPVAALFVLARLATPLLEVVLGGRYAYRDRWREALHYRSALREGWHHKWAVVVILGVELVWTILMMAVSYLLGLAWGSRLLTGFAAALTALASGHITGARVGIVMADVVLVVLQVAVWLVVAHLLGQYASAVFRPAEPEAVDVPA